MPDDPDEDEHRRQERGDDVEVYGRRWPYARLRVLDLDSREVRDMAADEFHVSEAAWSPDGLRLAYLCQPTSELDARLQTVLCGAGSWWPGCRRLLGTACFGVGLVGE